MIAEPVASRHGHCAFERPPRRASHRCAAILGEIRRRKVATAGLLVFLGILLIALFAPLVAPHDPLKQNLGDNFLPPAWKDGGTGPIPSAPIRSGATFSAA